MDFNFKGFVLKKLKKQQFLLKSEEKIREISKIMYRYTRKFLIFSKLYCSHFSH